MLANRIDRSLLPKETGGALPLVYRVTNAGYDPLDLTKLFRRLVFPPPIKTKASLIWFPICCPYLAHLL